MTHSGSLAYDFAVLRVVPHVHLAAFTPIGVIVHARTVEFLAMRALSDPGQLRERFPDLDHELLVRYMKTFEGICAGATGCNGFTGSYDLSGSSLRFVGLISTLRACTDPEMNRQERAFLEALDATRGWNVSGDTLVLSDYRPSPRFTSFGSTR